MYTFLQDHIELLFNKIRCHCGWNNNPNVLELKFVLHRLIIQNSIEPSNTGNCTHFGNALCECSGLLDFSWKRLQTVIGSQSLTIDDPDTVMAEKMLIENDIDHPNIL